MLSLPIALLTSCVSLEQLPPGSVPDLPAQATSSGEPFPELDLGWTSVNSSHFTVKGYRDSEIRPISVTAESIFSRLANDTGLYSFISSGQYVLTVYRDREEFETKTKISGNARVGVAGSGLYIYLGSGYEPGLAFELANVVLAQHLDERISPNRWIQQGIALNQELAFLSETERSVFTINQQVNLREKRIPFSQMTFATSASKDNRLKDLWYQQCESVVRFLMNQGSALSFGGFLNSLKAGADVDQALAGNYPGKFRNLTDLENAWKYTL